MSEHRAALLARAFVGATLVALFGSGALLVANRHAGLSGADFAYSTFLADGLPALAFVAVGYLVATRRPRNPVGWLMLSMGVTVVLTLVGEYGAYALLAVGPLPGGRAAAVVVNGGWVPAITALVAMTFVFPSGHLPTRRWRIPFVIALTAFGALFVVVFFAPLNPPFEELDNPLQVALPSPVTALIAVSIAIGVAIGVIGAVASVVVRWRRSWGDEREQLKWFVFAAAVIPLGLVVHTVAETFFPGAVDAVQLAFSVAVLGIPVAIGIAILRYRLYEIDRIISRALVYASLTVVLGTAYAGLVLAGQAVFSSFAGGSNLAIAVSTLVVAGLFLPLRSRVQGVVDRRFYRRRYDAQRTLEAFGARLREEVDLDVLASDLRDVVTDTLQPVHLSLWLREGDA